jgi:hypothetical protein
VTVQRVLRELLQVRILIAQVEAELGKAAASLERAVGCEINEHPFAPSSAAVATPSPAPPRSVDVGRTRGRLHPAGDGR